MAHEGMKISGWRALVLILGFFLAFGLWQSTANHALDWLDALDIVVKPVEPSWGVTWGALGLRVIQTIVDFCLFWWFFRLLIPGKRGLDLLSYISTEGAIGNLLILSVVGLVAPIQCYRAYSESRPEEIGEFTVASSRWVERFPAHGDEVTYACGARGGCRGHVIGLPGDSLEFGRYFVRIGDTYTPAPDWWVIGPWRDFPTVIPPGQYAILYCLFEECSVHLFPRTEMLSTKIYPAATSLRVFSREAMRDELRRQCIRGGKPAMCVAANTLS